MSFILFYFFCYLFLSSPLSTSLTFPLNEWKDFNPSLLCGEVSHRGGGVLNIIKTLFLTFINNLFSYIFVSLWCLFRRSNTTKMLNNNFISIKSIFKFNIKRDWKFYYYFFINITIMLIILIFPFKY